LPIRKHYVAADGAKVVNMLVLIARDCDSKFWQRLCMRGSEVVAPDRPL
jgi:hypothetical protein